MANDETGVSKWVEDRLAGLDTAGDWQPDAVRGLARLRDRRRRARRHRFEWAMAATAGAAAVVLLVVFLSPGACARPRGCSADLTHSVGPVATARPQPETSSYKESGAPTASVVCEIYTDYECPSCAQLYKDVVPRLTQDYVRTGKIRLLHRDFPLPQHPWARLAARYANAAGIAGQYPKVVDQIFRTQPLWSFDGGVDIQVAQVVDASTLNRIRALVANDSHLDDTVTQDIAMGRSDAINQTPTLVIVAAGKRQVIPGVPPYNILQTYLNDLLSSHSK